MVLHPEAYWGGLPSHVQKTKIYNLETSEYSSTPPLKKKSFGGSILQVTFGREFFWREYFKKTFGGKISKNLYLGTILKNNWREHFGKNILARNLKYIFHFENSTKCSFFK